jgi:PAS domain S-box-containing protein
MALQGTQEHSSKLAALPTFSPRFFVLLAFCAALYYGAAKLGLLLALAHSNATPVWPPSGLALALFLLLGRRAWPAVMAGAWIANALTFVDNQAASGAVIAVTSGAIAAGNTLEALIAAHIMRSFGDGKTEFRSQLGVYRFCACIASAAIVAAAIGTLSLTASGIVPPEAAVRIAGTWWIGDFLGMLIVTPACMLPFAAPARMRLLPVGLLALVTLAVSGALFADSALTAGLPRFAPYMLLAPVLWAALKYGRAAVILQLLVIGAVAVPLTAAQHGPFASGVQHQSLLSLCAFLIVLAVVGYVICADRLAFDDIESASGEAAEESWMPLALLIGCLALTVSAWSFVSNDTERRARERFDVAADAVRARLVEKLNAYESLLRSGSALFEASQQVEQGEWEAFVRGLNLPQNYPGVMGLGYAAHIPAPRADAIVAAIRADGQPTFRIWPEGRRELYVPVTFLEPQTEANAAAVGYDMHAEAARARAIDEAALTGRLSATGPVRLVQQARSEPYAGFLMFIPILEHGGAQPGGAQTMRGFVYCPLRLIDLVNGIFGTGLDETKLEIFDGVLDGPLMFASSAANGNRSYLTELHSVQWVQIGDVGHQWVLRITPTSLFDASVDQGKPFIVLVLGTMVSLLFFGISRNLAEARKHALVTVNQSSARLKEKSDILAESEASFKLLTSAIRNHAILKLDPSGRIVSWNAGAKRLFGYDAGEIVGRDVGILANPPGSAGAPSGQAAMLAALEQGQFEETQVRYRRDGSSFLALAELFPIVSEAGREMGFATIIRDVTDDKAAEQELFDAKVKAEAASEAKSAFVANMSHELRTPMNAVLGIAQLLSHTDLTRDQQNYLQMISVAGRSLLAVINDVLDFSKIEANKLEIVVEPFTLDDIVDSVASVMAVNAADKPVTVSICVAADVPHGLVGDAQRIGQILVNLVSNAIKFTERGSVALDISCTRPEAGMCDLEFCVDDSGIGMDEHEVATLFTPFSQADASMARRFGGTGLGLAISQRFAALMGGRIRVESVAGAGSGFTFAVRLKVHAVPDPYALAPEFSGLHLLYAEEDTALHRCALELAKRWGWSIDVVSSTAMLAERLADYARAGQRCDLILASASLAGAFPAGAIDAVPARLAAGQAARICLTDAYVVGARAQLRPDNADAVVNRPLTRSALYRAMSGHGASGRADPLMPQNKPLAGISVLLAEDNPLNQVVACGMLEMAGASVHIVANGSEAVSMLKQNPASFDLVLMDVQMPVMDGFSATESIRRDLGMSLPVLAMSAGVTMVEQARCQQAGMNDFIPKPVEADVLVATILRYGRRERAPVASRPAADGVFDIGRLEAMAGHDSAQKGKLVALVRKAIAYGAETAGQIHVALAAGAPGAAADGLHSLRGTLGTLGAKRFVRASSEAERLLRSGRAGPEDVRAMLDLVWAEQAHTVDLAEAWLRAQDAAPTSNEV